MGQLGLNLSISDDLESPLLDNYNSDDPEMYPSSYHKANSLLDSKFLSIEMRDDILNFIPELTLQRSNVY